VTPSPLFVYYLFTDQNSNIIHAKCARANQFVNRSRHVQNINVSDLPRIYFYIRPASDALIPIPLAVDFLLQIINERINAKRQKIIQGVRNTLHVATQQRRGYAERFGGKVADVINLRPNVARALSRVCLVLQLLPALPLPSGSAALSPASHLLIFSLISESNASRSAVPETGNVS
jgi:hypothetical protein